ncbi:DUF2642 domain-containing protein [Pseudobacillus wudalianchiensis]|uniref:DUF2642 domain-containing protein n=1 Tax=Pseudobacillus wudalianchiensis TaxID=1743143 RepID=A0A1B9B8D5_9BACI|nr:DUF2642 domain-containing protein [Bacillus wudalianchiensis]OCA92333.1 hypothetical protein A8F95_01015 [Bacillus wudalianchiensis]
MLNPYFSDTLKSLIGYSIGIFSSNGTLIKGSLADVKEDYLILQNKEGDFFYYHLHQIKSIAKNTKDLKINSMNDDYLRAEKLQGILEHCKQQWVTINCHNDQLVTGYLSDVFDDHIILISSEEKIIMQTFHISNVFPGFYESPKPAETDHSNKKETVTHSQSEELIEDEQEFNQEAVQKEQQMNAKIDLAPPASNESEVQREFKLEKTQKDSQTNANAHSNPPNLNESEAPSPLYEEDITTLENLPSSEQTEATTEGNTDHQTEFLPASSQRKDVQERSSAKQQSSIIYDFSEEPQQNHQPIADKENGSIDYGLSNKSLGLHPITDKGPLPISSKHEESQEPSVEDNQSSSEYTVDPPNLGKCFFRKKRSTKELRINKRSVKRHHVEEKRLPSPSAEDRRNQVKTILTAEEKEKILESQYYSLMMQAEKNYMELRKKRLDRESLK